MKGSVSGEGACFIKAVLHVVNESEQREIICNNLRLIPLDEMQTVFGLSPSLFSHAPYGARQLPPGGSQGSLCEFALVHFKWYSAYRRKPLRRDAPPPLSGEVACSLGSPVGELSSVSETEGVLFVEWQPLKKTNSTPFAASRHETEV